MAPVANNKTEKQMDHIGPNHCPYTITITYRYSFGLFTKSVSTIGIINTINFAAQDEEDIEKTKCTIITIALNIIDV